MILAGGVDTNRMASLSAIVDQGGHFVDPLEWKRGIRGLGFVPLTSGLRGLYTWPDGRVRESSGVLPTNPIHPSLNGLGCAVCSDSTKTADRNAVLDLVCRCGPAQADSALPDEANPLAPFVVNPILASAFGMAGLAPSSFSRDFDSTPASDWVAQSALDPVGPGYYDPSTGGVVLLPVDPADLLPEDTGISPLALGAITLFLFLGVQRHKGKGGGV